MKSSTLNGEINQHQQSLTNSTGLTGWQSMSLMLLGAVRAEPYFDRLKNDHINFITV
jgi:hypothetical protein